MSHHSGSPPHRHYNKGTASWKSSIRYIKVAVSPRVGWKNPYLGDFWRRKEYLKFARTKHPYCSWSLHAVHQAWTWGHAENRCGIDKPVFPPFLYLTKQKQKHQNSIFLLYSPQRAQWAQTPIQNSSKHSRCESVLLNFQPECSSIFMCLLYENSTIWMIEHKPMSHPSVVARMVARGHKGDGRRCFWGRRQVVVFWNATNGGKRTAVLSGDRGETGEVRRRRRRRDRRRSG